MSSIIDLSKKYSGHETVQWIKNCLNDSVDLAELLNDGDKFMEYITQNKPKDFKNPRKPRASKKSSSERSSTEHNCQLCDARVWNDGLGAQCCRKKIDGQLLCTIHLKESSKNNGSLRNGLFNAERPTHPYNDESLPMLPWDGVDVPKKSKKSKKSSDTPAKKGTRKCGICGECGHNKKTCPQRPQVNDDGSGTGLNLELSTTTQTTTEEFNQSRIALSEMVGNDSISDTNDNTDTTDITDTTDTTDTSDVNDSQETVLLVPDQDGELDEDVSIDQDDPISEDLSSNHDDDDEESEYITYQGVEYTLDKEDNIVYDAELDQVGTWDGETIEFINAAQAKLHRVRKLGNKKNE